MGVLRLTRCDVPHVPGPKLIAENSSCSKTFGALMNTSPTESTGAVKCARQLRPQVRESEAVRLKVLLVDPVADRRDGISRIIAEVGGSAHVVAEIAQRVEESLPFSGIALVALGSALHPSDEVLEVIARLRKSGFEVVAYEDTLQQWSVRAKCLALSAGAVQVLDSCGVGFPSELRWSLNQAFLRQVKIDSSQAIQSLMHEHGIVGNSPAMLALFRKAIQVSKMSDLPVLITGETGTGKELLARAIHRLDPKRTKGLIVAVNCAAVNPGLLESEFFGQRRGAFTGADRNRKGLIRAAEGGVLFLDEIGELDLALQAKLLRVLQEKSVLG